MEAASNGVRVFFSIISEGADVAETLVNFARQMEEDYEDVQDIELFIFAVRSFFCWNRAEELHTAADRVDYIRTKWMEDNDAKYTSWLASSEDAHENLKWSKWTFQAKNTILSDFLNHVETHLSPAKPK